MELVKMCTVKEFMEMNSELKLSDLDLLRDWYKKQPHLPPISDSELALFLHSNYYRIEPTKMTIDTYFTIRTHVPEFFSKRDPLGSKELRETMRVSSHFLLAGTTPEGYKILFAKLIDSNPSHYLFSDDLKLLGMSLELWLHTADTGASPGQIAIIDLDGVVFGHVARLNLMTIKKFLYYIQEAVPLRLKSVEVVNTVPFIDTILNLAKPFLKKELLDIIHFHKDYTTLSKLVPMHLLPNEQGGKAGSSNDLWAAQIKNLEEHRTWFQAEETRKANEAVRPGKQKNATDIFGVEGSFKKLDID